MATKSATDLIERWRSEALTLPCIAFHQSRGNLSQDFTPEELSGLTASVDLKRSEKTAVAFALHIWNMENPFDLSGVASWDQEHMAAFTDWVTGKHHDGWQCHYF